MKIKPSKSLFALTLLLALFNTSCNKKANELNAADPVPVKLTAEQIRLIESENRFAFDIFKETLKSSELSKNIIISPFSISVALSMTLNGAGGSTRESMFEALRINGISTENLNSSYKNLSGELLNIDKKVSISVANSVWTENNFTAKKPFTSILTDYYSADSKSFDINDPQAPKQINLWIESKTNGLIKEMINNLNDNTVMLLINAIYFKGKWKSQFNPKNTVQSSFYKHDGSSSVVPMMKQTHEFRIYQGNGFVMGEFPYGQGNYVMDIILPEKQTGLNGIIPDLNEKNYKTWIANMKETKTDLSFPRFKFGYKKQMKDILTNMGMGIAFTNNADFSNISDDDLLINDVIHQAFIETNEEGTEAAAATVVDIGLTSMPVSNFILNVDHSFIYIIRESSTNTILIMGTVADPLAN